MPLIADQIATITNRWYDGTTDTDGSQTSTLSGVSWFSQILSQVSADGLHEASLYKMRVFAVATAATTPGGSSAPAFSSYLLPAEWRSLASADRPAHWTLQPGDTVMCGGTTATVLAVHDNRGCRKFPHIYVEAK